MRAAGASDPLDPVILALLHLVDDNAASKELWERQGGIFIHHTTADRTIEALLDALGAEVDGDGGSSRRNGGQAAAAPPYRRARVVSGSVRASPSCETRVVG